MEKKKKNIFIIVIALLILMISSLLIIGYNNMRIAQSKEMDKVNSTKENYIYKYIQNHFLNFKLVQAMEGEFSESNKLNFAIAYYNKEKGNEGNISFEDLNNVYKTIFGKDTEIENPIIAKVATNHKYTFNEGTKIFEVNTSIEDKPTITNNPKMEITDIKNNNGSFEVSISVIEPKLVTEFLSFFLANNDNGSNEETIQKLNEIYQRKENTQEDNNYLISLINDENKDKLAYEQTTKITVQEDNNNYIITNFKI